MMEGRVESEGVAAFCDAARLLRAQNVAGAVMTLRDSRGEELLRADLQTLISSGSDYADEAAAWMAADAVFKARLSYGLGLGPDLDFEGVGPVTDEDFVAVTWDLARRYYPPCQPDRFAHTLEAFAEVEMKRPDLTEPPSDLLAALLTRRQRDQQ